MEYHSYLTDWQVAMATQNWVSDILENEWSQPITSRKTTDNIFY